MTGRLLLMSNSTNHGQRFLEHCAGEMKDFLGEISRVLFIPYALADKDGYAEKAREGFGRIDVAVDSIHDAEDPVRAVHEAESIFVGGGNTFRLLTRLYELDLLDPIRDRVASGMPFMGASAGTNVACVTIKTTNDMPIVYPPSFDALGFVPFNINCHYLDPVPDSSHMGETRELRIREFHEDNEQMVVGLREGAWLRVEGDRITLGGANGARVFRRGGEPEEIAPGSPLEF